MSDKHPRTGRGPFHADQLKSGDPYELSDGHAIYCAPTGGDGSRRIGTGFAVIDTDPGVSEAGVDTGYSPAPGTLWAPDIAVGNVADTAGWVPGVPPLAVEYAGSGQDEDALQEKIADLLARGTQWVWVVRLAMPRHVEVHAPGKTMERLGVGQQLRAPGVLRNPIAVEALLDRDAAHEATLRNLLQRHGYASLDELREQGIQQGREQGIQQGREQGRAEALRRSIAALCEVLDIRVDGNRQAALAEADANTLEGWLTALKSERRWPA